MSIRRDVFLVSSVLFSIALLRLAEPSYYCARANDEMVRTAGLASLTIIFVGLVVAWTGFIERRRSAWLVLALIAWVWAFPITVWPLHHNFVESLKEWRLWLANAWQSPGLWRTFLINVLMFLLMLTALILPIPSLVREIKSTHAPSEQKRQHRQEPGSNLA